MGTVQGRDVDGHRKCDEPELRTAKGRATWDHAVL